MSCATPKGTQSYVEKMKRRSVPDSGFRALGRTGWQASTLGFGGYRIDSSVSEHRQALEKALLSGCNLVDTSTNYTDGGSEECLGEVINEMLDDNKIKREELIVVSKVGYIQGNNLEMVQHHEKEGHPFPEVVKYSSSCFHCIHPEFIEDQIVRSLERLRLETIDVYLLHNPEYYLSAEANKGKSRPIEEIRAEFYARIRTAFKYLESVVQAGRISHYGVSSNSFVMDASDAEFTSIEEMLKIARDIAQEDAGDPEKHHFSVVQMPGNLFESGMALKKSLKGGTQSPLEFAAENNLAVLVNRPLNAFLHEQLVRLADPVMPTVKETMEELSNHAIELEKKFNFEMAPLIITAQDSIPPTEFFRWGIQLQKTDMSAVTLEQWRELQARAIYPALDELVEQLDAFFATKGKSGWPEWRKQYLGALSKLFARIEATCAEKNQVLSQKISELLDPHLPEAIRKVSLSQKALTILAHTPGVSTVLVGMRRESYVDDALKVLGRAPITVTPKLFEEIRL